MIALIDRFNQVSMHDPSQDIVDLYKHIPEINELDNRAQPICRPLFSHSSLPDVMELEIVEVKDFDFKSKFSYFVHVHHNQPLWAKNLDVIPRKILDEVRSGNGKLIFDNTLEGKSIEGDEFLNPFYESIDKLKLPTENIYFITNNLIAEKTHQDYDRENKINIVSVMWNVFDIQRLKGEKNLPMKVRADMEYKYKSVNIFKIKHFLKINRTNRDERDIFMLFLNFEKLLDKCLVSFPELHKWPDYPDMFYKYTQNENIEDLKSQLPFDIDETDETNHGPAGLGKGMFNADLPFDPIHYRDTFISIVMGAFPFDTSGYHLHSSTFNPMYCGHPIIQFAPYKTLDVMKQYGFKTFDKWWDESYDNEKDDWKRLQMIMDLVLKLSDYDEKDLLNMYEDMRETLQHNINIIEDYDIKTNLYDRIYDE
jgi:hypothetical protein|tara:strand:- start:609 stop:1880 length:1272 start_codon:yes stop_codon:yes gene_type:complete